MAKDNNILPNNDFNPLSGGDSNGGEQPRKPFFSGVGNFFNKLSDRAQEIRTPQDEIDANLNNAFFLSDLGGSTDGLLSDISITPKDAGIIEAGISPTDISPKPVGVRSVGTVGGQIIGSQPLTVASAGLLPLGLMEKRRKAMRDAATAKQKKVADLYKTPTTTFEYQKQLTNQFLDYTNKFVESINGDTSIIGDFSDPKYKEYYQGVQRLKDAGLAFNGFAEAVKGLEEEIASGERTVRPDVVNIMTKFKNGEYDLEAMRDDPKAFNQFLDDYSKMNSILSISKVANDFIIDGMSEAIKSTIAEIESLGTSDFSVINDKIEKYMPEEAIFAMAKDLQTQIGYSDKEVEQLVDFVKNKIQSQVTNKFKTPSKKNYSFERYKKDLKEDSREWKDDAVSVNVPGVDGEATGQVMEIGTKSVDTNVESIVTPVNYMINPATGDIMETSDALDINATKTFRASGEYLASLMGNDAFRSASGIGTDDKVPNDTLFTIITLNKDYIDPSIRATISAAPEASESDRDKKKALIAEYIEEGLIIPANSTRIVPFRVVDDAIQNKGKFTVSELEQEEALTEEEKTIISNTQRSDIEKTTTEESKKDDEVESVDVDSEDVTEDIAKTKEVPAKPTPPASDKPVQEIVVTQAEVDEILKKQGVTLEKLKQIAKEKGSTIVIKG